MRRVRFVALLTGGLLLLGCTAGAVGSGFVADPCTGTGSTCLDKRLDKVEAYLSTLAPVTVTATPTTTVPATTAAPTTTAPATTSAATTTAPATTAAPTTSAAPTTTAPAAPASWPDSTNTGVPAGTNLTAYTGPCTITVPTTIDSKTVNCALVVFSDLTIIRSKVNGQVKLDTDRAGSGAWHVTVTDSEVDAGLLQEAAVCCGNMNLTRVNVHGGQTAVQCEELSYYCQVTDSWLHGQRMPADQDWHLGGFLSDGTKGSCTGTNNLCIELTHNSVVCDAPVNAVDGGCTGDINFIPNFAAASNILVKNNLLRASVGLSYCTYGGEKSTSPYPHGDHIVYQGNVFERGSNGLCGHYGPVTGFNTAGVGNSFDSSNVWADNGAPVTPEN